MATIEYKNIPCEKDFYFSHKDEDRLYQRVVAGIVPPSEKPGAIVVLAEEVSYRPPFQVYWLAEAHEKTLDELIERTIELKADFRIQDFYGRISEETRRYLELYNRDQREKRMPQIQILSAPYSDSGDISAHINILRDRTNPAKKSFHFGKSKSLPGAFQEIPVDKLASATDREYPAVAALAYALAVLTEWEYQKPGGKPSFSKYEYDPLNYN